MTRLTDSSMTHLNVVSLIAPLTTAFGKQVNTKTTSTETNPESFTTTDIDSSDVPSQASITQGNGDSV